MKKNYTLIAFLLFIVSIHTTAQVNYSFSAATAAYVPVTGGITPTLFMSPFNYNGDLSYTYDEGMANAIPIGFTFNYNGINYDKININANGFATLGAPFQQVASESYFINNLRLGPITVYTPVPGDTITNPDAKPVLAPLWDDLTCQADANLRYITTGSSGSRVFTFEWSNAVWQYDATQSTLSFELKLYESTNQIEFCYKDEGGTPSAGASASIGITASSHQGGGFMSLQNTSSSPSVSTSVETDNLNIKPANNQVYKFTPLPCGIPFNTHYNSYTNTSVNFSWDAPPQVSSFEYTVNTSPYDPVAGTSTSSKNAVVSSLTPNTKYYIHIRSYCSVVSQSVWLTEDTFRTANNPVSLPYSEGFESGNPNLSSDFPPNFRQQDFNDSLPYYLPSYYSWQSRADISQYAHNGSQFMIYLDETYKANDWFYLPGFNLTAGKSYKLKFYYAAPFEEVNPNSLEVKYGEAIGAKAMTSGTLFNNNAINNINYIADSSIITPATSGLYFIGFHCYSDSAKGGISIDDISLEVTNTLPVTLLNFSGEVNAKQNLLHWSTASEQNNTGFEVQRSNDGHSFNKVGFVNTKAANGNSNLKINYDFSDIGFAASANYYRLKQIDKDGKFNYSNIVVLNENVVANGSIEVYPNPAKNILNVKFTSANNRNATILIADVSGKIVLNKTININNDEGLIQLDISQFAAGAYLIKLISADGAKKTTMKFVKQ